MAFMLAAGVRAIPEVLAGVYPVGWDTIAFYVPTTFYWAAGKAGVFAIIGSAPLIYLVSVPLFMAGLDPVWTFKLMGPILYGLFSVSLLTFFSRSLKWAGRNALAGGLLTSLYFVTLRIGWDMYRSISGLSFLLLALSLATDAGDVRRRLALATSIFLAVVSDQFTGAMAIVIVGAIACLQLYKRNRSQSFNLLKALAPGFLTFGLIAYAESISFNTLYPSQPPLGMSWTITNSVVFLGYAYLPLLPFALVGIRNARSFEMALWSLICLTGAVVSAIPFMGMQALGYRWCLLLTVPLCVYAASGLSRIAHASLSNPEWLRLLRVNAPRLFAIFLIISALSYMLLPPQHPAAYFSAYPSLIPTSMSQNTIPLSDSASVVELIHWLGSNMSPSSVLITHQSLYGWALEYLPASVAIMNYGYGTPLDGAKIAVSRGYSSILLIWWANGAGWFGQTTVPDGFSKIRSDGDFAIYEYA